MDNIVVKNAEGQQLNINIVRFFRLNSMEYLIFSLNEVDEGGYVKLYITKVKDNTANTIVDDVEWNMIKDTIKTIIKSNKDNFPLPIVDLNVKKINDLQVIDQKVFKLNDSLLKLLSANKKEESYVEPSVDVSAPVEPLNSDNILSVELPNQYNVNLEQNVPNTSQTVNSDSAVVPPTNFTDSIGDNSDYQISSEDNGQQSSNDVVDYKILYEDELNKNAGLIKENENYKNVIEQMKEILCQF